MRLIAVILVMSWCLVACGNRQPPSVIAYQDLPAVGDASRGEQLFIQQGCSGCHNDDASAAPHLINYYTDAATRVEGQTAREYTFYSIVEPWRYTVTGYGNIMPNRYDDTLTPQDIVDLITYLEGK